MTLLFELKSVVHLSDVGQDSKIRLGNLIDKFQNAGWLHFQQIRTQLPPLDSKLLYFVVSQSVRIRATLSLGDPITIQSFITDANRHKITRLVEIRDQAEQLIASQLEDAFVVNNESGRIAKLPVDYPIASMVDPTKHLGFHRDRIDIPVSKNQTRTDFRILPRDIDNYGHMNNARYLDFIDETVDHLKQISINYLKPAKLGMTLDYLRTKINHSVYYTVSNGSNVMSKIWLELK